MNFVTEGKKYIEMMDKKNKELDERFEALKKFKEETGLKGPELKKAFNEYWEKSKLSQSSKPRGRPSKLETKKERSPSPKSITHDFEKPKKTYKESNLMKARSDLKKKGDKYGVETEMNIKKGLEPKVKRALKKSIDEELDKKLKGRGIRKIKLDMSSDEEVKPKRTRGRPKKGKGYYDDESTSSEESSSDEEDIKEYSKILKHLVGHLTDRKEKLDPKDAKQAKELINRLIKKRK